MSKTYIFENKRLTVKNNIKYIGRDYNGKLYQLIDKDDDWNYPIDLIEIYPVSGLRLLEDNKETKDE